MDIDIKPNLKDVTFSVRKSTHQPYGKSNDKPL